MYTFTKLHDRYIHTMYPNPDFQIKYPLRLLQQHAVWLGHVPDQASPVCTECRCVAYILYPALLSISLLHLSVSTGCVFHGTFPSNYQCWYIEPYTTLVRDTCFTHVSDLHQDNDCVHSCSDQLYVLPVCFLQSAIERLWLLVLLYGMTCQLMSPLCHCL